MADIKDRLTAVEHADTAQKYVMLEAAAEIERLRIALDDANKFIVNLTEAALEYASDLESEIEARYSNYSKKYPAMVRKYERDMEPVMLVRKLILSLEESEITS